jgi:hypothetical protein
MPDPIPWKVGLGRSRRPVGLIYPRYRGPPVTTQNFKYDQFPPATNGLRTIHFIPENDLIALG